MLHQKTSHAHHSTQHPVKAVLDSALHGSGGGPGHSVAHGQTTTQQVEQQHLFSGFNGGEVVGDIIDGQGTFSEGLEQCRLLFFVQEPLETALFEHPIFASALVLRGHRRPQGGVEPVGSRHAFNHSRGSETVQYSPNPCCLSAVHFCCFVQGQGEVPLQQGGKETDRKRISGDFRPRSFPEQAKIVHPMREFVPFAVRLKGSVVHQTDGKEGVFILGQLHR